jgi:O-acetyl-ADP-ribose deacetylase (regulator of RNase III)
MSTLLGAVNLAHGRHMELVKGDLTVEHVDVIVNAANQWLQHGAGVAGAISQKGGKIIQQESDAWVERHGPITKDSPAYTSAGNLPCNYVIHVVGPVWGEGDEEDKLQRAITSALRLAKQLQAHTLSIPPISTGIFGFPKEKAAPIFFTAISEYGLTEPDSCLETVRITIIDEPTCSVFLKELEKWKKDPHSNGL